jgi:hypothetical protein
MWKNGCKLPRLAAFFPTFHPRRAPILQDLMQNPLKSKRKTRKTPP